MSSDKKLIHDVVELQNQGMKHRAIARALRISRNTVRKILEKHDETRTKEHSALAQLGILRACSRPRKLDPFRPKIDELLHQYPDITSQRVWEILKDIGFDGGYTGVKTLVRSIRPKSAPKPSLETQVREPGKLAESDWSQYLVKFTHAPPSKLQAFGYALRYSTRKFFSFHEGNGLHPLMDGHVQAFERFEGVEPYCKYDCQKPVVLRWEGKQPIYNPRFIDFATYYEFSPEACRPGHPNDKPRVERGFYELEMSFFRGRSFRDLADLRAQLTHWMDTIADLRPIKRLRNRSRMELFAEERPFLRSLPRHPYDTARLLYKLCDLEGYIAWDGNWYSLPYEYVTEILPVRVTADEIFIYKQDLKCIARHPLFPRSAQLRSILDNHRPARAERGPDLDQLRLAFDDLGEPAAAFLSALEKNESLSAGYHARKILALRESYDTADLLKALSHALSFGALEHKSVERILFVKARRRKLDEYIAEASAQKLKAVIERSCTEPRDLAEYDALPCRGAITQGDVPCPNDKTQDPNPEEVKSSNRSGNTSND